MSLGAGMFFVLMSVLSLGQGTEELVEDFEHSESPESLTKTVVEISSMVFPLIPISSQGVVFKEVLKTFLPPSELATGIIDTTVRISTPVTNAIENFLAERSGKRIRDKTTNFLNAMRNSLSDEDRKLLSDIVSEENIKSLLPQAILELPQSPEFQSFYSDLMRTIADNRNLYDVLPLSWLPKNESTISNDTELHYSDQVSFVELPEEEHSNDEDSILTPKAPNERVKMVSQTKKLKRSVAANEESLYSVLSKAIASSKELSRIINMISSPESKAAYEKAFTSIKEILGDEGTSEMLQSLIDTIDSTFEQMTPEKIVEAFANALEQLLNSTKRLTPKNRERLFGNFVEELTSAAESLSANDDPDTHVNVLGLSIFSFLLNEELAEFQNFEIFMKYLESELQSLGAEIKESA